MGSLLRTRHLQVLVLRYACHRVCILNRYELSNRPALTPCFALVSVRIESFFAVTFGRLRGLIGSFKAHALRVLELFLTIVVKGEVLLHGDARRWIDHLGSSTALQSSLCRVHLLALIARTIILIRGKARFSNCCKHGSTVSIGKVISICCALQFLIQIKLRRCTYRVQTLTILAVCTITRASKPWAMRVRSGPMPMHLLKLLVVLLCMFLLWRRLVCLIVRIATLADKAAFLRKINRVTLVYVSKRMLRNANLLTLVLLAPSGEEIERRALIIRFIIDVIWSTRVSKNSFWRALQEGVDLRSGEYQALLTLICLLIAS